MEQPYQSQIGYLIHKAQTVRRTSPAHKAGQPVGEAKLIATLADFTQRVMAELATIDVAITVDVAIIVDVAITFDVATKNLSSNT
jgi:hypothetical protein